MTSGDEKYAYRSLWSQTAKTIDGYVSYPEWITNFNQTISSSPLTVIGIENDAGSLYMRVLFRNQSLISFYGFGIMLDAGDSPVFAPTGEPQFMFSRWNGQWMFMYAKAQLFGSGSSTGTPNLPMPAGCIGVIVQAGQDVSLEMQISLGALAVTPGSTIPFFLTFNFMNRQVLYPSAPYTPQDWAPIYLSSTDIHAPVLSNPQFTMPMPRIDQLSTFSINFSDADNNAPDSVSLVLDGSSLAMAKQNPTDNNYIAGCIYQVSTYLKAGAHGYYFSTAEGLFIARYPASSNLTTPSITSINLHAPTLANAMVNIASATNFTTIVYTVNYSDLDNNPPASINVVINGTAHAMSPSIANPSDFIGGILYRYETRLSSGNHLYFFNCSDGLYVARAPVTGSYSGPTITAGSTSALFDGEYGVDVLPAGLLPSSLSSITKLKFVHTLLSNGTYLVQIYGYVGGYVLLEDCNENPQTGIATTVHSYVGSAFGGGAFLNAGQRDTSWIPLNATLGNTYLMVFAGPQTENFTITGQGWVTYGIYNRSCWILTDAAHSTSIYYDKATGVFLKAFGTSGTSNVMVEITMEETNALDFHAPIVNSLIVSPGTGSGTTVFNFTANVHDYDGIPPSMVELFIDGQSFTMNSALNPGTAVQIFQGVDFSKLMLLPTGTYQYYLTAFDGRYTTRFPANGSNSIVVSGPNISPPVLTNGTAIPFKGNEDNIILFLVKYSDADNNPPAAINVTINGIDRPLQKLQPANFDLIDGCWYFAKTTLSAGVYNYHFNANDGRFTSRQPLTGDLQVNVSTTPITPRLFTGAEALFNVTLIGNFDVNFTEIGPSLWLGRETAVVGNNSFSFNETTRIVNSNHGGLFGNPGGHVTYVIPQNVVLGDHVLISAVASGSSLDQNCTVVDATVKFVGNDPKACWVLQNDADSRDTWYYEESTGFLMGATIFINIASGVPTSNLTASLVSTNIFNYHAPLLQVHQVPSGLRSDALPVIMNMTYQDLDNYKPMYFRIHLNNTVIDAFAANLFMSNIWAAGVTVLYQAYLSPGTYSYWIEYSDGIHLGRYPSATNGSFTLIFVNNQPPVLTAPSVSPNQTHAYTMPIFLVKYSDADNNPPTNITVKIDSVSHNCMRLNPSGNDYVDGVQYYFQSTPLAIGLHTYMFSATDGIHVTNTTVFSGPRIQATMANLTAFDGMVIDWQFTSGLTIVAGRETYNKLLNIFNVTETITGNPTLKGQRVEFNNSLVASDTSIFGLQPGSNSMFWHPTNIVLSPASTITINGTNGALVCHQTTAGIYQFNGKYLPVWFYSSGTGDQLVVDQHTGIILHFWNPVKSFNYSVVDSNAFDLYTPMLSNPSLTPTGPGTPSTLFTFRVNAADGNGVAPAVTLVLNSLRYSMNPESTTPDFKQGTTFTVALYIQPGTWSYHFEASDHCSTALTGNQTITITPVANHFPVIVPSQVTPTRGDNYTWFEFSLIYSDQDNYKPQHVIVRINGTNHPMIQAHTSDTNYMDGVQFIYETQLTAALHDYVYYYNASNDGITNVIAPGNGSYGNLLVRPGAPTVLADDAGYGIELVNSFGPTLYANYTYAHEAGNNFLSSVMYNFVPPGTFVVNNVTRVMSNYTGPGNFFFPQNSLDTFFIPRNVHNGSLITFSSGNGTVQTPITGSTIISVLGMQFHAWIVSQGNVIAWYDMETGFLLRMIVSGSSSFVILNPVYGTMFHNYYLPTLSNENLVNASGNSAVQRQFTIMYQDGDNVMPGRHQVVINGTAFNMVQLDPLDRNVMNGKLYVLRVYFQPGTYPYFYKFSDNLTTVRYPLASNGTFTVSASNNNPPVLSLPSVTPQNGYNDTRFEFDVNYADMDNNVPVFFNVTLNGIDQVYNDVIPLMPANSSNTYYVGGSSWLAILANLPKGNYSYSFAVYDGRFTRSTQTKYFLVKNEVALYKVDLANLTIGIMFNYYGGNNPTNYNNVWYDLRARHVKSLQLQGPITANFLACIDVLWLDQNGGGQFTSQDLALITNWIAAGGCAIITGWGYGYYTTQLLNAYNIQTYNTNIAGGTFIVSSQYPIAAGVSSITFENQKTALDLSRASTAFVPVVTTNNYPEIVAYQNARNGKIVIINDGNGLLNNYYNNANNRLLSNNIFGWFASFDNFYNCTIQSNGTTPANPTNAIPVTFKARYIDLDNHGPVFVNITIDGLAYSMQKQNATDYNFNAGVYYQYTTYLQNGTHFYSMAGADGSITARTALTPLFVTRVDNYLPAITSWLVTNTSHLYTDFAYICNYTDRDNNAPIWVKLSIDGQPSVTMQQVSASVNDYIAGVLYYYNTTLGIGTHSWYVICTDNGTIVRSPSSGSKSGPLVLSLNAINGVYDGLIYNWTLGYPTVGSYNYTTFFKQINGNLYNITTFEYGYYGQGTNTFTAIVDISTRNVASISISQIWYGQILAQAQEPEFWFIPRGMTIGNSINIWLPMNGFANYTVRWIGIIYSPLMKSYFQALILQDALGDALAYDQKTGLLLFISTSYANAQAIWCQAFNNNNIPSLKSPSMVPASGNLNQAYFFTITYSDADSNPPTHVQLFIDGQPLEMQQTPGIANYSTGCIYHLQAYLQIGTHSYWFYASDGLFNASTSHFSTPNIGSVNNYPPTLTGTNLVPLTGYNYTVYTFSTTYADPDNNAPAFVRVSFNGTNYNLAKVNASDTNYMDGAIYSTSIVIHKEGLYRYFMVASDGLYQVRSPLDPSQYYLGPNITASLAPLQNYTIHSRSFSWESTNVTVPISSNSNSIVIGLPFSFKMYDQSFNTLTISTRDTFIRMNNLDPYEPYYQYIPSTGVSSEYILGIDSQLPESLNGGSVRYGNLTNPNRVVVEFDGVSNQYTGYIFVDFQIVLYQTGLIAFNINDFNFTATQYRSAYLFLNYGNGTNQYYNHVQWLNQTIASRSWSFVYPPLDTFSPSIIINSPVTGTYAQQNINVNLATNSPDLNTMWYNVYNTGTSIFLFTNQTYNFHETNMVSVPGTGNYVLHAWANDMSGNVAHVTCAFSVNLGLPLAMITSPLNQTYKSTSIALNLFGNGATASILYNIKNNTSGSWIGANVTYSTPIIIPLSNGLFTIYAWGRLGNGTAQKAPTTCQFRLDTSIPSLRILSPANNTVETGALVLNIQALDGAGIISRTWFNIYNRNTSSWVFASNQTYSGIFSMSIPDDYYYIKAWTNDTANNVNSSRNYFLMNNLPPVSNHPADFSCILNQANVFITWILQDIYPGQYRVLLNTFTQIVPWTNWYNNVPIMIPVLTNISLGVFNYTIIFKSGSGISGIQDVVLVTLTSKPVATSIPATSGTIAANSTFNIQWTLTATNGAGKYRVTRNDIAITGWTSWPSNPATVPVPVNTNIGFGQFNYTMYYNDSTGVYGSPASVIITVDDIPTSNHPGNHVITENTSIYYFSWFLQDVYGGSGYYNVYLNNTSMSGWHPFSSGAFITVSTDTNAGARIYNYTIAFYDNFGLNGKQDTALITVNDHPVANSLPTTEQFGANDTLALLPWVIHDIIGKTGMYLVLINGSLYTSGTWSSDVALNINVDTKRGYKTFNYTLHYTDNYTLPGSQQTVLVTIAGIPISTHPPAMIVIENVTTWITWSLTDHSGSSKYRVLRNGAQIVGWTSWQNATAFNVSINTNIGLGKWNYTLQFNNSVGKLGTPSTVKVIVIDPITLTIMYPANGTWFSAPFNFRVDVFDKDFANITYQVDGLSIRLFSRNASTMINSGDWTSLGQGYHQITIIAQSLAGDAKSGLITFLKDTIAPTTTMTQPTYLYTATTPYTKNFTTGSAAFTLIPEDNTGGSGVAATSYRITVNGVPGSWASYAGAFTLGPPANGTYTIAWYSTDNAGNVEGTHHLTVYIDIIAPITTMTQPSYIYTATTPYTKNFTTGSATFALTAADNTGGSGVAATIYKISANGAHGSWTSYTGVFTLGSSANGTYTIAWYSTDNGQNVESTQYLTVYIDTVAITTTMTQPSYIYTATTPYTKNFTTGIAAFTLIPEDNTGGSGVAATSYRITVNGVPGSWTSYAGAFTLGSSANGTYTIAWYGTDNVGNVEDTHHLTVYIDAIAPIIGNLTIEPINPVYNKPVNITCNASDGQSGLKSVILYYKVSVSYSSIAMKSIGENLFRASVPGLPFDTIVSYYVQAVDNASNTNNFGDASLPYSYGLNYLEAGVHTIEFTTPVKLDVAISVAVSGNLTLATLNPGNNLVESLNISYLMATFDLNFTGIFIGTVNMTYYYGGSISGNVSVYHWDGTAWRLLFAIINSQQGTVKFSVSSLSPFIIGIMATPAGFDILKFVENNWLLLSIIAIALIAVTVAVVVASRKKKSVVKTKTTKELVAKRIAAGSPQAISGKMEASKPQLVDGKMAVIEGKKAGVEKYQKSEDVMGPKTAKELEELQRTELEVTAKMDVKLCIVHKGPIKGANYSCPQCNTFYCLNCAATLASTGEGCWSCGHKIELDATLTAAAAKQLQSKETAMFYCASCDQYHEIEYPDFVAWVNCPVCSHPLIYSKPCPSCNQPIALSKEIYTAYKDKTIPCPNCNKDVVL